MMDAKKYMKIIILQIILLTCRFIWSCDDSGLSLKRIESEKIDYNSNVSWRLAYKEEHEQEKHREYCNKEQNVFLFKFLEKGLLRKKLETSENILVSLSQSIQNLLNKCADHRSHHEALFDDLVPSWRSLAKHDNWITGFITVSTSFYNTIEESDSPEFLQHMQPFLIAYVDSVTKFKHNPKNAYHQRLVIENFKVIVKEVLQANIKLAPKRHAFNEEMGWLSSKRWHSG